MKKLDQVETLLNEAIPRDVVREREGGGRSKLSYLEGHYVIDRLNKVFGPLGWASDANITLVHEGKVNDKYVAHYVAKVRIVAEVDGLRTEHNDYGYGDGMDRSNPGKAHELAVKEAVTDGIKRCAKNFGMSMGLALYDKDQTNVDDGPAPEQPRSRPAPKIDHEKVLQLISGNSRVILSKGTMTKEEILAEMQSRYKVDAKEKLTPEQANEFLNFLKEKAK